MAKKIRRARKKTVSKSLTSIAQQHITRRIGSHQRASQKRKEARKALRKD